MLYSTLPRSPPAHLSADRENLQVSEYAQVCTDVAGQRGELADTQKWRVERPERAPAILPSI